MTKHFLKTDDRSNKDIIYVDGYNSETRMIIFNGLKALLMFENIILFNKEKI